MSPGETAGACVITAVAVVWLGFIAFDLWHKPRTTRRFQATARAAATWRTEADVQADLATAREARRLVEQHAFDVAFHKIITVEYAPQIPQQTRRTEEDQ
ncbi:hypothetical protein OS965_02160 [Streptomyces sp. H27-G5]|uniref:hypothetical protein n=1 Tax=Streptomyces sp. H27-G5 TaxID=2996698 RepID=UPI00226E5255|nr:hypothetical protein [Streptomyces sp. H27-G5]MCY0916979.1 hypothetical protein [Streptomyces sp. H27-G5]